MDCRGPATPFTKESPMSLCATALLGLVIQQAAGEPQRETPREQAIQKDPQRFQGTCKFESLEEHGEKAGAVSLKGRSIFFGADTFLIRDEEGIVKAGMVTIDPSKKPKTINAVIKRGLEQGEIMLGIYALEGDTLKVCFDVQGQERPKEF